MANTFFEGNYPNEGKLIKEQIKIKIIKHELFWISLSMQSEHMKHMCIRKLRKGRKTKET